MTTKLIAENILNPDMFSSATEQDGEHIGQPESDSGNEGNLRLLTTGDIQDFSYAGTATGDGAGDNTTTIDALLCMYGDDYFIGGTIEITSGGADGESQTITDFAQATGTITHAAFSVQITTDTTFTLTLSFATRDFKAELVNGGDVGDADFKWSHDGGNTYLGRNDPYAATWLAQASVATTDVHADITPNPICQAQNGDILVGYKLEAAGLDRPLIKKSSDNGITWDSPIEIMSNILGDSGITDLITLRSGRILAAVDESSTLTNIYYSDDNGTTWSPMDGVIAAVDTCCLVELPNGNIVSAFGAASVYCKVSVDGGLNWGDSITVASDAEDQKHPKLVVAENGDLICVYATDEDSAGDFAIKCKISTDSGATWGSAIDVIDDTTCDWPDVIKDIDGTLYAIAAVPASDLIKMSKSTDNGETWTAAAAITLYTDLVNDIGAARLGLIDNCTIICVYNGDDTDEIWQVRRGMWEAYTGDDSPPTANECPCAIERIQQHLCCDVKLLWKGSGGIAEDKWTFEPEYYFGIANIIDDSPSKPWRSETDNAACNIVIDSGANVRALIDGIAFFGCNVRTLSFQMNDADVWGAPSVDESVSFDLATGEVDAVAGRNIQDTSLLANYKDHALKGYYFRATSGTDDGVTWKILDNVGSWIVLDTEAAHNIAAGSPVDTFVIFQSFIAYTFTNTTPYRYLRISIGAQHTAEDYYQIGMAVMGKAISLTRPWNIDYGKSNIYDIKMLRTINGGLNVVKGAERKRKLQLSWNDSEETYNEIIATIDHLDGKNLCLIPDSGTLTDCYLVKSVSDITAEHVKSDEYNFSLELEEIL